MTISWIQFASFFSSFMRYCFLIYLLFWQNSLILLHMLNLKLWKASNPKRYWSWEWTSMLKALSVTCFRDWHETTVDVKQQVHWYLIVRLLSGRANIFSNISQQVAKWDEQLENGSFPGKIWNHQAVIDQDSPLQDILLLAPLPL